MRERQLREISTNVCLVLKNQQTMLAVLERMPSEKTKPQTKPSKSKRLSKQDKRKRSELKKKLPKYPTTQEVLDALEILSSNFYRNVYEKLLFPVKPIGKQPCYRRAAVIKLKLGVTHEPGAHTYSKLRKKKRIG